MSEGQYKFQHFFPGKFACWDCCSSANICDPWKTDNIILHDSRQRKSLGQIFNIPNTGSSPVRVICIPAPVCLTSWINVSHWMCEHQSKHQDFMWCCLEQLFCSFFWFYLFLILLFFFFLAVFMMCQIEAAKSPWKPKGMDLEWLISRNPIKKTGKNTKVKIKKSHHKYKGPLCLVGGWNGWKWNEVAIYSFNYLIWSGDSSAVTARQDFCAFNLKRS